MVGNCEMSRYDGAVSRAGLVPCLHCVLLLSPDVHIHTLPPRAPSKDSYPPAAINLGAAQLGGWGNPSGQKSWTQIVVIASPQISGAWHRAGTGPAVLCPLLPLAPAVYWKNVNYEFFTSLVTRWCPADRKYPTLCDGVSKLSQVSAIQCQ